MKAHTAKDMVTWAVILVLTVVTIVIGSLIGKRAYVVVSMLVAIYAMVPFFVRFERGKPQAREIVMLAVMIAIIVAARAAFAFLPNFKPMAGLVMIAGMAFGASSGFLCGSISMLASNMIFGQGPWTPFQMLSYGICGFFFGLLAELGVIKRANWSRAYKVAVGVAGFAFYLIVAGPILDTSSVFWMLSTLSLESAMAIYLAGVPFNLIQAAATFLTIFLIGNAMLRKLERLRVKYGMLD